MQALVFNPIGHADTPALRRDFPAVRFIEVSELERACALSGDCEVLIALAHFVEDELLDAMPKLRWLCSLTSGVDHLFTLKSLRPDVRITSGRGIHGPQMAELAFLYMLNLIRRFERIADDRRNRVWERRHQSLLWSRTIAIVGVGTISEELAQRAKAFGMRTVGVSNSRTSAPGFDEILPREKLAKAVAGADFVVALAPLNQDTLHMFDARIFAAMRPSAFFINIARGPVVDEAALIAALNESRIAGAGLDVFETEPLPKESPLWSMPNVIVTPRIGGMSDVYDKQIHPLLAYNLRCYLDERMDDMRNIVR